MHWQRKIMQHHGNIVLLGCFPYHRVGAGAVRTLHVLKHHNGRAGARRRLELRTVSSARSRRSKRQSERCGDINKTFCQYIHFANYPVFLGVLPIFFLRIAAWAGRLTLAAATGCALLSMFSIICPSFSRTFTSSTKG